MPRYNAVPDSKGGGIEDNNGWCDFQATDKYRDSCERIFGKRCTRCKVRHIEDDESIFCDKCKEETNGHK